MGAIRLPVAKILRGSLDSLLALLCELRHPSELQQLRNSRSRSFLAAGRCRPGRGRDEVRIRPQSNLSTGLLEEYFVGRWGTEAIHQRQSHIPAKRGCRLESLKLTCLSCFGSWKPNITVVCHVSYGARSLPHAVCQTPRSQLSTGSADGIMRAWSRYEYWSCGGSSKQN